MDNGQGSAGGKTSVRSLHPAPRTLLLLAASAVMVLMVFSDFGPVPAEGLDALGDDPGEVSVIVVRCRPCSGGFLLNLTDGRDGWADAFCPRDVLPGPLANGTSARVVAQRSAEDPDFLYVQRLAVVAAPTGKD